MGREYAGVFGCLAFTTVVLRGVLIGGLFDNVVQQALMMMFAFAGVGFLIGSVAQQTIRESVLQTMREQLEDENRAPPANTAHDQ